jgi:hypothetical protein
MQVKVWFKSTVVDGDEFAMIGEFVGLVDDCVRFQPAHCEGPIRFSVVDDPDVLRMEFIR